MKKIFKSFLSSLKAIILLSLMLFPIGIVGYLYTEHKDEIERGEKQRAIIAEEKREQAEREEEQREVDETRGNYSYRTNMAFRDPIRITADGLFGDELLEVRMNADVLHIRIDKKSFLSTESLRYSVQRGTARLLEIAAERDEINMFHIKFLTEFVDSYGNARSAPLAWYQFSRETMNNINFERFDFKNISVVADSYFEHPALNK